MAFPQCGHRMAAAGVSATDCDCSCCCSLLSNGKSSADDASVLGASSVPDDVSVKPASSRSVSAYKTCKTVCAVKVH